MRNKAICSETKPSMKTITPVVKHQRDMFVKRPWSVR